jgi:hypothetical protein
MLKRPVSWVTWSKALPLMLTPTPAAGTPLPSARRSATVRPETSPARSRSTGLEKEYWQAAKASAAAAPAAVAIVPR